MNNILDQLRNQNSKYPSQTQVENKLFGLPENPISKHFGGSPPFVYTGERTASLPGQPPGPSLPAAKLQPSSITAREPSSTSTMVAPLALLAVVGGLVYYFFRKPTRV